MRHYYIYLLKPDVAASYFGKEWLIFQLFVERDTTNPQLKEIVKKQIKYITETIPSLKVKKNLDYAMKVRQDFYTVNDHYYIDLKPLQSKAVLKNDGNVITISVTGGYQAETVFFEILRKIHPCFFAMDFENKNYGWLNPVKQVSYI